MTPTFQMSPGRIGFSLLAIALEIALPLVLALWARRRLGVGWRYFGYGALIFFLFQVISRVPLVTIAGAMLVPTLADNPGAQLAWGAGLALTAGLFEEVGRYIGYRWLMRREEKTWRKAVCLAGPNYSKGFYIRAGNVTPALNTGEFHEYVSMHLCP
jgi:uncharacterized membrane protein YhfC